MADVVVLQVDLDPVDGVAFSPPAESLLEIPTPQESISDVT